MPRRSRVAIVLRQRLSALETDLAGALAGEVERIHRTRVASRRMREALPVLATGRPGVRVKQARRAIRQITRALGGVREMDVALEMLAAIQRAQPPFEWAATRVRARLEREREVRRTRMCGRLEPLKMEKLLHRLNNMEGLLSEQTCTNDWRVALAARLARRGGALEAAVDRAGTLYAPDRLHEVRIATKKLRYSVELARDLARLRTASALARLKRVQQLLGRLHDLDVLLQQAHALQVEMAPRDGRRASDIDDLTAWLEDEIRRIHAKYMAIRGGLGTIGTVCRDEWCPALAGGTTAFAVAS